MAEPDERLIEAGARPRRSEGSIEAPDADVAEQAVTADPAEQPGEMHRGLEVDEWDAWEQSRVVELDDDYR
jgi:hypothetical protein